MPWWKSKESTWNVRETNWLKEFQKSTQRLWQYRTVVKIHNGWNALCTISEISKDLGVQLFNFWPCTLWIITNWPIHTYTHTHTITHTSSTELRLLYTWQMIKSTVLPGSHEFRLSMTAKYVCKMALFYLILIDLLKRVMAEKKTLIRGILKTSMLEHLWH